MYKTPRCLLCVLLSFVFFVFSTPVSLFAKTQADIDHHHDDCCSVLCDADHSNCADLDEEFYWELDPLDDTGDIYHSYVSIQTSGNKTVRAYKYIGSDPAPTFPNINSFPSATYVLAASRYYNCHSYAWYFCGNNSNISNANAFWFDNTSVVDMRSHTDCYSKITSIPLETTSKTLKNYVSSLAVGDIVLYWDYIKGRYRHSAVITGLINNGSNSKVIVRSKWADYAVYQHEVDDCPFIGLGDPNADGDEHLCLIEIYRPLHNLENANNSINPTMLDSSNYSFPLYLQFSNTQHKKLCSCGRSFTYYNHTFEQISPTIYRCVFCGYSYTTATPSSHNNDTE